MQWPVLVPGAWISNHCSKGASWSLLLGAEPSQLYMQCLFLAYTFSYRHFNVHYGLILKNYKMRIFLTLHVYFKKSNT